LPDNQFSNQKSQFENSLDGLGMEKVSIICGQLDCVRATFQF
jgi:hypothetical protein